MAVVTVKSVGITNRDASPRVLNDAAKEHALLQRACGKVSIANADSVASKYIAFSIPSNAVVQSVVKTHPDIGLTTAGDIGLYQTTANGGAVVDADFFTAASVFNAGAVTKGEVGFGNILSTPVNQEKRIWEALGLSSDPRVEYDVVITLTGAADAAGDINLECLFVQ